MPSVVQSSNSVALQTAYSALVGGITAQASGGKFEEGARTAAYGYLFNELMHSGTGAMRRAGYKETAYPDGTYCNIQGSPACGSPGAASASEGANVVGGSEVTAMVGFGGVSFGAGKGIDTNQNVCTVMQGCVLGGWGLYIGAEVTGQAGKGSLSTGSMGSISLFGKGGVGPSANITPLQVNADRTMSGQIGAGVGAGFGAGVKVCQQVTSCP